MESKDYWFALKSSLYVEFKEEKILLYDTKSGSRIETCQKNAISLVSQLYEPENLGVVILTEEMQSHRDIDFFVREVIEKQMGDLRDMGKMPNKPVRLIPILNLQKDVEKLKKKEGNYSLIGTNTKNYLLVLNIYLNTNCFLRCPNCDQYYKQFSCCTTQKEKQKITFEELEHVFHQIEYSSIGKINILGGNIFEYSYIEQAYALLDSFKDTIHCYFHYENYKPYLLPNSLKLEMMVTFPVKEEVFKNTWDSLDKEKTTIRFIIENVVQYEKVKLLIANYSIEKYIILPFYTGNNLKFFEENVYLSRDNIFSKPISMREIFRNQKLNINFFGSLFILPDGELKSNMNVAAIGNIKTDSLLSVIFKEMIDNTSWRTIRDKQPCNKCIYQFLCPAPSNYETVIGKHDLCHIEH